MCRAILLAVGCVLLNLAIAPIAAAQQPVTYWLCTSGPEDNYKYVNAVVPTSSSENPSKDFAAHLARQYGVSIKSPQCHAYPTATAELDRRRYILGATSANRPLVETNWKPPNAVAPPAPSAPAPPATPKISYDSLLAALPPEKRTYATNEMAASKQKCQSDPFISALFDCDCFARAVFHHRLRHPDGMDKANVPSDPSAIKQPYVSVLTSPTFDCSECIDDARVRTWAGAEVEKTLKLRPAAQQVTGAKLQELKGCVAAGTLTGFRARPIWRALRDVYNVTFADCLKRSSP